MYLRLVLSILSLIIVGSVSLAEDHITDRGGGQSYNAQRGQYFNGKTYFCFSGGGDNMFDPMVMSYNHSTGEAIGPIKVGENPLAEYYDDHGNPGMLVDKDGYIHIVYGGHGHFRGNQMYVRSTYPEDITTWTKMDNIEPASTYPTFLLLSNGTIFLAYRDGDHRNDWVYQTSTDNGDTWSPKIALLTSGIPRIDHIYYKGIYYDSWYAVARFFEGQDDTIHLIFNYHACADDWQDDYHLQRRTNIYHMKMLPDGEWQAVDGTPLTLPITREEADQELLVYESPIKKGYPEVNTTHPKSLDTDNQDRPYIAISVRLNPNAPTWGGTPQFIKWTGIQWQFYDSLPSSGEVMVISPNIIELYNNTTLYRTEDGGITWMKIKTIHEEGYGARLIYKFHPSAKLSFWNRNDPIGAERFYLWGENGFVTGIIPSEYHWLEAEYADSMTSPMQSDYDDNASEGEYIYVPNNSGNGGAAACTTTIINASTYIIWGRVMAPHGEDDSFLVQVDNGSDIVWEIPHGTTWQWHRVKDRDGSDPAAFTFTEGVHTLKIKQEEDGTKLDKILITNDWSFIPSEMGAQAENLPSYEPMPAPKNLRFEEN